MSATDEIPPERSLPGLVVETPRLILRLPVRADAERVAELANDVAIAENLASLPHPYGLDDALAFIDNAEVGPARWNLGIYLKDEGAAFVGMASLMPRDGERHVLGYWIGRRHWNRGLATEAAQGLSDYAFEALGADVLTATARVTNGASRRVLEKCGFQYAGQGMGPSLFHRGLVPIDRFRLERSIWTSLRNWAKTAVGA